MTNVFADIMSRIQQSKIHTTVEEWASEVKSTADIYFFKLIGKTAEQYVKSIQC